MTKLIRVVVDVLPENCADCPFSTTGEHPFTKCYCPLTRRGWIINEAVRDPNCPLEIERVDPE